MSVFQKWFGVANIAMGEKSAEVIFQSKTGEKPLMRILHVKLIRSV